MKLNSAIFENQNIYTELPKDLIFSSQRRASLIDTGIQLQIDNNTVNVFHNRDYENPREPDHVARRLKQRNKDIEIMTGGYIDDGYDDDRWEDQYIELLVEALQEIESTYNMEPYHYVIFSQKDMCILPLAFGVYEEDLNKPKKKYKKRFVANATTFMPVRDEIKGMSHEFRRGKNKYFDTRNIEVALEEALNTLCESKNLNKSAIRLVNV